MCIRHRGQGTCGERVPIGKDRRRLTDILKVRGLVTEEQLERALEVQATTGKRIGEILVDMGFVADDDVTNAIAERYGIERARFDDTATGDTAITVVPKELLERYLVFPLRIEGDKLYLAMADPLDVLAQDTIRTATGYEVVPLAASQSEIRRALARFFNVQAEVKALVDDFDEGLGEEEAQVEHISDSPTVRIVDLLVAQGIREGASDIHIQPEESRVRVRYRVDGRLRNAMEFRKRLASEIVARIKIVAGLDITQHRRPQDGRMSVDVDGNQVDLRVSTLPTIYGEKVVLRVLRRTEGVLELDRIPFQPENMRAIRRMLRQPQGLILVTGPTGSGKTTTLYSFLQSLNRPDTNVITVEDPVELRVPGLSQVAVNVRGGITFASALRAILRQDPDIVMVGEMRDQETAEIAVRAALTGHLVLSTMHTNSAAAAVVRLIDMGIEPFLVAGTLVGVVGQRLVRRLCRSCKKPVAELDEVARMFFGERVRPDRVYQAVGCGACGHTGHVGRTVIEEALLVTRRVRSLIRPGIQEDEVHAAAREYGMVSLKESGLRLIEAGETSVEEVLRAIYSIDDIEAGTTEGAAVTADGFGVGAP